MRNNKTLTTKKWWLKAFLTTLLSGAVAQVVVAQDNAQSSADNESNTSVAPTASNATLPIDIVADSGSYDQQAGIAVYEGNVVVTQGIATVKADRLEIILQNNQVFKIVATGKPASIDYRGNVQPVYGEANTLNYLVTEKKLVLTDKAMVKQGDDVIRGAKLAYELDKEKITGERVRLTLQPAN